MSLRLGYLTGQYPRVTDTFIRREVATLRAQGHHVQTFSVREPAQSDQVSESIAKERRATIYLLPPRGLARAHLQEFLASPSRYAKAIGLAWRTCPPGLNAKLTQLAYFMEAGLLPLRYASFRSRTFTIISRILELFGRGDCRRDRGLHVQLHDPWFG